MRILNDFKINFKFPKIKMENIGEIEEVKVDLEKQAEKHKNKKEIKSYPTTSYSTVKEAFIESSEKYKEKSFILEKYDHKEPYKEISRTEFHDDVINLGTALTKVLNLQGERIVVISETTYHWYVSYMALLCGAGIAVPLDKELPANEIENVIKRARATAVIYSEKKKDIIKKVRDNLTDVKYFIKMNCEDAQDGKDIGLNYLINEGKKKVDSGDNSFMQIKISPDEFALLIFTSGTTSNSKGVMISNRNLAENINACNAYVKINEDDMLFSVLPLHHTYESTIGFLYPMATGTKIAICEGLKYIVPNLKEIHPTAILTVPLLVESLYKKINANIVKSKKDKLVNSMIHVTNTLKAVGVDVKRKVFKEIYDNLGGRLRIIVSAAAPIDPKVGNWLEDIGIMFLQGYGLTETAPISALTPEFDRRVGSAGKAVVCAELKINEPNEAGEGEVYIKSKTLMLGYYEDEEATKSAIFTDENGDRWFNSGDVGYLDKDGFLYITGRSKNVIVTQNGKNIYPEEIELLLGKIPEIKECMVYGKEEEGEKELLISVKVIPNMEEIEEKYGNNLSDKEVYKIIWDKIKETNKTLTSYKAIKNLEIKNDEFEKTTTMKIKRFAEISKDKAKK